VRTGGGVADGGGGPKKGGTRLIGAHVSMAGGFHNAVTEAVRIQANCFAMYTGAQRTWYRRPITAEDKELFKKATTEHGFAPHTYIPHASYLINLGGPDEEKLRKSREQFIEEMQRCEQLGCALYNVHPGSHLGACEVDEAIEISAESINIAHAETDTIIAVIENTAGSGYTIGYSFEQLRKILDKIKNKSRVAVCLDTNHLFAAGYDLSSAQKCDMVFKEFDEIIGMNLLKAVHVNDSKKPLNSRVDRHEIVPKGCIGVDCFKFLVNDPRFLDIPLILETEEPLDEQIKLLRSYAAEDKQ